MRGAETDIVASVGQTDLEYDEFSECKVSGSCLRTLYRSRWNTIIDKEDVERATWKHILILTGSTISSIRDCGRPCLKVFEKRMDRGLHPTHAWSLVEPKPPLLHTSPLTFDTRQRIRFDHCICEFIQCNGSTGDGSTKLHAIACLQINAFRLSSVIL